MYTGPPPPPQYPSQYPQAYAYTGPPPPMARPAAVTIVTPVSVRWPNACANCGAPPARHSDASLKIGRVTRTYQVPVCMTCAKRETGHGRLVGFLFFLTLLMAAGMGYAMLPLRKLGFVAFLIGVGLAIAIGLLFFVILKPKKPVAPFTSGTDAVRLTAWNASQAWFYCTNPEWAQETVRLSGGFSITPTIEKPYRAWGTFLTFPVLTVIAEAIGLAIATPDVMFRNDTAQPLAFYVDGEKRDTLQPGKFALHSETYGRHTFGWGPPSDSKPAATVDGTMVILDKHLLNPDQAGCFWLEGAAYGAASVDEKTLGPLPLETFYTFDKVDLWFEGLPKEISTKQSGETRIAVQVYPLCVEEKKTCKKELVDAALACDRAAPTTAEGAKCWDRCDEGAAGKHVADKNDDPLANAKPVDGGVSTTATATDAGITDAGTSDAGPKKKKRKKKPKDPTGEAADG